jgi:hypothetical protein
MIHAHTHTHTHHTMKLTTVIGSVNNNPKYYMFIPKQILFWKKFGINFIAVFVGNHIPNELLEHQNNIVLWQHNSDLNPAYVGQNIRMYYAARIDLPDDEMVMLTDMDMLPTNPTYYTSGLEQHKFEDFIYYRHVDGNQIYMCYNAAHPKIWGKVFNIRDDADVCTRLNENYNSNYNGVPGSTGWSIDQEVMYNKLIHYEHLKILNRPLNRLETWIHRTHLQKKDTNFLRHYDDAHFHRSYHDNADLIMDAEHQLHAYYRA